MQVAFESCVARPLAQSSTGFGTKADKLASDHVLECVVLSPFDQSPLTMDALDGCVDQLTSNWEHWQEQAFSCPVGFC